MRIASWKNVVIRLPELEERMSDWADDKQPAVCQLELTSPHIMPHWTKTASFVRRGASNAAMGEASRKQTRWRSALQSERSFDKIQSLRSCLQDGLAPPEERYSTALLFRPILSPWI
jgi:hypothetical protein